MDIVVKISTFLLAAFFLFNAFNHASRLEMMSGYAGMKGVPLPRFAVLGAGVVLFLIGAALIFDLSELGAVAALLFFIPVSVKMHDFWTVQDPQARAGEMTQFMKNLAILSGLLIVFLS